MLSNRSIVISWLALLLSGSVYPCNIVIIGGYKPTAVNEGELSGTVVGSGRIDLMGKTHDEERRSITVGGATILIRSRTDTEFFKKGEVRYPPGVKASGGNLKEWQCGSEVLEVRTDQAGQFKILQLKPGKYCLDVTAPQAEDANQIPIPHSSFIIDVVKSGPRATLIANISPQWPDCSGGSSTPVEAAPLKGNSGALGQARRVLKVLLNQLRGQVVFSGTISRLSWQVVVDFDSESSL